MSRWTLLGAALTLLAGPGAASAASSAPMDSGVGLSSLESESVEVTEAEALAPELLIAQGPRGKSPSVSRSAGTSVTRSSSSSVSRSSGNSVSRSSSSTVRVHVPYTPPQPARTAPATNPGRLNDATAVSSGSVRVQLNVRPPTPAPPPPAGAQVIRPPAPPPPAATPYRSPRPPRYHSGTVFVYPRVYSTMWGWWWWSPPGAVQSPPQRRPASPDTYTPEPEPERQALHVGDYSFGIWSGVNQGAYRDGSEYSDPGIRFSIRHRATPHLGMDISGGYYGTSMYPEGEKNQRRVDMPLQLSSTFHLFPTLPIQLYGLAGVTVDFRDFQKVGYTEGVQDFYYEEGRFQDTRFGPHFGLGAEVMVGESLALHGDTRWTYYTIQDGRSADQTFPVAFSANAGVSFYF